jgi:ketosteroid isomerase-like protein
MSAENVAFVKKFYNALNHGEGKAALDRIPHSDDFELDFTRSVNPDLAGHYHGRNAADQYLEEFEKAWETIEWFATEHLEVGEKVIRVGGIRAAGRGGIEVKAQGAQVWEFRDGKAVAMRQCQSKEQALEVARDS